MPHADADTDTGAGAPAPAALTPGVVVLLWVAGGLVLLAGIQLFVFTERTDRYFAWTIQPPLTAAFLGASYWSAVAFEWMAARARTWAHARIAVPTVFVFTTLTLVVTLVHLERFHLGSDHELGTQLVTWAWIAVYSVVPLLMVAVVLRQRQVPGADPPRARPLPAVIVVVVAVQAAVLLPLGAALLVVPEDAAAWWPWALSPLTGRAVGAWLVSLGIAAAHSVVERDLDRLRPAAAAYLVFGVLQTAALARYADIPDWGDVTTIAYVAFLASTVATGAGTLALAARPSRGSTT